MLIGHGIYARRNVHMFITLNHMFYEKNVIVKHEWYKIIDRPSFFTNALFVIKITRL